MTASERPEALQAFLDALQRGVEASNPEARTAACLTRVFGALQTPAPATPKPPSRVSTCALLDEALAPAAASGGAVAEVGDRIRALDPLLSWRRSSRPADGASASYAEGNATTMLVGPGGMEDRGDVWVGLSLLAPDVRYPDHTHPPEEIYLVLTEGRFRQGGRDWFEPGVGGTFYNEPGIVHAMASNPGVPMLAVWCLYP